MPVTEENPRAVQSGSSSMLSPAAKNLFEKRFLDFQKLFIEMLFTVFFSSCPFVYLRG
jgi:hypothetical protein